MSAVGISKDSGAAAHIRRECSIPQALEARLPAGSSLDLREWDLPRTLRYDSGLGASADSALGTTDGLFAAKEADSFVSRQWLKFIN